MQRCAHLHYYYSLIERQQLAVHTYIYTILVQASAKFAIIFNRFNGGAPGPTQLQHNHVAPASDPFRSGENAFPASVQFNDDICTRVIIGTITLFIHRRPSSAAHVYPCQSVTSTTAQCTRASRTAVQNDGRCIYVSRIL